MKEIIFSIALLFSFSPWIGELLQDSHIAPIVPPLFEHEDECGSPVRESSYWFTVDGKVVKVLDGDTIIVSSKDNKRKRVNLVAIDASAGQAEARSLLSGLVLNRSVSVMVRPRIIMPSTVVGVVYVKEKEVNRELLAVGAVRYQQPEPYSMSNYTACIYRIVEREARAAKRGLWEKTSP
jgi:micrococcal nuclease